MACFLDDLTPNKFYAILKSKVKKYQIFWLNLDKFQ